MSMKPVPARFAYAFGLLVALILAVTISCQKKPAATVSDNKPVIPVARAAERTVTDYAEYTGRTDAVLPVNVTARASGYLTHTYFEEGQEVKAGQLLFEIDPTPYKLSLDSADAQVKSAEAGIKTAEANLVSAKAMIPPAVATVEADKKGFNLGTISNLQLLTDQATLISAQAKIDSSQAAIDSAKAALLNAQAQYSIAKQNLDWTQVTAPIDGQISRYYYVPGNLITANSTLLTTIVSVDSVYAYFDIEGRIFDQVLGEIAANKSLPKVPMDAQSMRAIAGGLSALTPLQRANFPVFMALEGQIGFPYVGKLDFINNQENPSTGTVAVRAWFKNERKHGGLVSLIPGRFVRVQLRLGNPHKAYLVIDRAISSDQGQKYVYVIDDKNVVKQRRVTPRALQDDGLRELEPYQVVNGIESGVKPDEWIVVGGLQLLKPNLEIAPEQLDRMPTQAPGSVAVKSAPGMEGGKAEKGGGGKGKK